MLLLNCIKAKLCFLLFSVYVMQCQLALKICHLLVLFYQITFSNDKVILYSKILTLFDIALTFHTLAISSLYLLILNALKGLFQCGNDVYNPIT